MKTIIRYIGLSLLTSACVVSFAAVNQGRPNASKLSFHRADNTLVISSDIVLDSLELKPNKQLIVTPVVEDGKETKIVLPSLLINGRNMHYSFERGTIGKNIKEKYDLYKEIWRKNGTSQQVEYAARVPFENWMLGPEASIRFVYDSCGCGVMGGQSLGDPVLLNLNPAPKMRLSYITPAVTELPVSVHEGKARVQFEVNKTDLHAQPYVCRNGQRIDNRQQLGMIEDSVRYALSNPNVEIAHIDICGYASPESPYEHNDFLATNRSRSLAEYIGDRFSLPREKTTYSSVPENWEELREIVVNANDITEQQRKDLLELIDAPAYRPADYDAKEKTLKTDKRFAALYKSKMLPEWFPMLRATKFAINTRLKPASDQQLAEIIKTTPELMSLNQMFRVARLYPEGSEDFNRTIETALRYYPNDPVANLNAAVNAIKAGDLSKAESLLKKAGDSKEADNARGVLEVYKGDFTKAAEYFNKASDLPEASKNKALLD